jgi:hypothetical protein
LPGVAIIGGDSQPLPTISEAPVASFDERILDALPPSEKLGSVGEKPIIKAA